MGWLVNIRSPYYCLAFVKQDDEFVVNYCLEAQWITYETTQEMLNYAKTRVSFYNICTC